MNWKFWQRTAEPTPLKDKINQVLTEARMVLPGTQAFLGFQVSIIFMESFDRLEKKLQYIHFISVSLMVVTIVLLNLPAAYHRIAEKGEDSAHFHFFAARTIVCAMLLFSQAMAADYYVILTKIAVQPSFSLFLTLLLNLFTLTAWFLFPWTLRRWKKN